MEIMLTEISPSLAGLTTATRPGKLKILILLKVIGPPKMQSTTSRCPSRDQQDESECAAFILEGIEVPQNTQTHTQKHTCACQAMERSISHVSLPPWGVGVGKSPDWEAEGGFGIQMVRK